ncbi:MAG TPA: trypsin-like peptidase domain-containing protein [Galbitalea sp.]|jgi:S1-C subfamily serine protease|nr:trypsin-like peptidase domain-containing protein [Galbitalea sp.]
MSINNDGQYLPDNQAPIDPTSGQSPVDPSPKKPRSPWIAVAIATAAVVCIGGLGTAALAELTSAPKSTSSSLQNTYGTFGRGSTFGQGQGGGNGLQSGGQAIGQQATAGETPAVAATGAQEVGLVTINTVLDYDSDQQAAGTGMILTSSGYILTNNHVIADSTNISVTVESTGKTYKATVVGSDTTADVAVLKLAGASGLTPVTFAPSEKVAVGQSIYSVGNAEGTGRLVTAVGTVGAINQSLTIGSDDGSPSEHLTGMIELQSDVVSGDSGGALFDTKGRVIGMVTAASSGGNPVTGDAINIAQVLKAANAIRSGATSSDIQYGTPAFAGINISSTPSTTAGVPVASTFPGMPAAKAGIVEGDTITSVNGVAVTTATQLSSDIRTFKVGQTVTIAWVDASGVAHSAPVTLVAGPAS